MQSRGIRTLAILFFASNIAVAQSGSFRSSSDVLSLGVGLGYDCGGLGGNILFYPHENIGLFAGGGYAFTGLAGNAGVKVRLTSYSQKFHPFLSAMYGHNVFVTTTNGPNKSFYGATLGAGLDIHPRWNFNYFSLGLLVPISGADAKEYLDNRNGRGISFNSSSIPVSISVSYRFVIK